MRIAENAVSGVSAAERLNEAKVPTEGRQERGTPLRREAAERITEAIASQTDRRCTCDGAAKKFFEVLPQGLREIFRLRIPVRGAVFPWSPRWRNSRTGGARDRNRGAYSKRWRKSRGVFPEHVNARPTLHARTRGRHQSTLPRLPHVNHPATSV
jgi:hypothetical protein